MASIQINIQSLRGGRHLAQLVRHCTPRPVENLSASQEGRFRCLPTELKQNSLTTGSSPWLGFAAVHLSIIRKTLRHVTHSARETGDIEAFSRWTSTSLMENEPFPAQCARIRADDSMGVYTPGCGRELPGTTSSTCARASSVAPNRHDRYANCDVRTSFLDERDMTMHRIHFRARDKSALSERRTVSMTPRKPRRALCSQTWGKKQKKRGQIQPHAHNRK